MTQSVLRLPKEILERSRRPLLLGGFMLLLLVFPFWGSDYYLHLIIMCGIGCMLSLGLNFFYGYCGQINFGVAGFYAIGAYACALLQLNLGIPFLLSLLLSVVIGCIAGLVSGIPLLRLRGHTLALGTVAFALGIYTISETWVSFTGGENGVKTPPLILFGQTMGPTFHYYLVLLGVIGSYLVCRNLVASKIGRAMRAIRADERVALASGVNVFRYRLLAFVINCVLAALAGALMAQYVRWIGPSLFGLWVNTLILIMVCFGGLGSNVGALIGGAAIMLLPEVMAAFEQYRYLAYGFVILMTLRFLPDGIMGAIRTKFRRT